jgi:L-seryl-tRNA(Ser) seleniumtransferase
MKDARRGLPSVNLLLETSAVHSLLEHHPRQIVLDAVRSAINAARTAGQFHRTEEEWIDSIVAAVRDSTRPSLRRVINATGVVIHTNLGRAPLSRDALESMQRVGAGYSNLEIDIESGQRGSRHDHLDAALREATGAEAGIATNNTAAGLTLALAAIADGREVIISRGELVEIGGGFRVPEILEGSGAQLREVGTTNRTRVADYAAAISERTAAILRVHPSNFRMQGFTERPALADLAALATRFGVPLIEDQGSGWLGLELFAADAFPADARAMLAREPAVRNSIRDGADLVAFSGDKLLGGPQAGLVVGRAALVARMRQHPLMRALRVDKVTYAGLETTLRAFTSGRAALTVPVMRMLAMPFEDLEGRAEALAGQLRSSRVSCDTGYGLSTVGGGSLPGETLPTHLVRIQVRSPDAVLAALRHGRPTIIARIVEDRVCLDLRTVPDTDDELLAPAIVGALT